MATFETSERGWKSLRVAVSEVGASVAIGVIWLAVMFDAIFGPDIVNTSAGGDSSRVPSAVVVAFFAFLATWVLARRAFPSDRK
jgi:hypothetical protein